MRHRGKGPAMKFRVTHHLRRDGKEYGPGDAIELSKAEASQCGSALEPWGADEAAENAEKKKAADQAEKKKTEDEAAKSKAT